MDTTPPTFGGLQRAWHCTPGPQAVPPKTPFSLSWQAASDDVTPPSQIVYDVYVAFTPGDEYFARPTYVTAPGATEYQTPQLLPSDGSYFVVRARDQAGNEDHNTVEQQGVNPCF